MACITDIDINFEFTTDTPNYWDGEGSDPDNASPTLQEYQRLLWSKVLPIGKFMDLKKGSGTNYLYWNEFRFGSDSIINMYSHHKNQYIQNLTKELKAKTNNYDILIDTYIRKGYTIGGEIIFPKNGNYSINSQRGTNKLIRDRFDLTVECIRRYYNNIDSPLSETLNKNKSFFDLFIDFKGYIEYFILQDIVDNNYTNIDFFLDLNDFDRDPYPKNVEEWFILYNKQMEFLNRRNKRILNYIQSQ